MDRREFLKTSALGGASVVLGAVGRSPANAVPLADSSALDGDRILVVIRLDGGNDGLNTVLPLDQYDALAKARGNILIPQSRALRLDDRTGLHPSLEGLQRLWKEGNLRVVQAVGYPSHNQSHFRSTDIWFTGSDSNEVLESGVLGRYLETRFPNFPDGYPKPSHPHPPAIQIGSTLVTLLQGETTGMGIALSDPSRVYAIQSDGIDAAPDSAAGHELTFIRLMASQTRQYGQEVADALAGSSNRSALYPATGNRLADQLKGVARLIAGGLETRVYVLSLGGFDTHAAQVAEADTTTGKHADLLRQLSVAIEAFLDDLRLLGLDDRVVGMTISEFGRRILSNASLGTDHGTASPSLLFGKPVAGGISGTNPTIPATVTSRDNVAMQHDFRSVYATLLRDWMGLGEDSTARVMRRSFPPLDLVQASFAGRPQARPGFHMRSNRPNPARDRTTLEFTLVEPAFVELTILDLLGRPVRTVARANHPEGTHRIELDVTSLRPGRYICRMKAAGSAQESVMDVLR